MTRFPFADRPRLWGTAVSHYQVEGNDPCDWTEWERAGRTRGEPCGDAGGSWQRYEEDAELAAAAGANAFRFSVSWSRVEPRLGRYDDGALQRYVRLVDKLHAVGLEPIVTLFHYTHPLWFHAETPWTSTASVERFAALARRVTEAFGERVRLYVPLNELLVFALAGTYDAQIPPGIADGRTLVRVVDHLLAAHRGPNRGSVEPAAPGRGDFLLPPWTRVRGRRDDLPRSIDLFGVNFYSRLHLRCPGSERMIGEFGYRDASGCGLTDNGWEIVPEALGGVLVEAARVGKPLMIVENGVADAADRCRPAFIEAHLGAIARAARAGLDVHGYLHWSLLDNYEWLDGFGPKFGLYEVDRATMQRRPRPSVETFRRAGKRFLRARAC